VSFVACRMVGRRWLWLGSLSVMLRRTGLLLMRCRVGYGWLATSRFSTVIRVSESVVGRIGSSACTASCVRLMRWSVW
jgi:hypothetical protein